MPTPARYIVMLSAILNFNLGPGKYSHIGIEEFTLDHTLQTEKNTLSYAEKYLTISDNHSLLTGRTRSVLSPKTPGFSLNHLNNQASVTKTHPPDFQDTREFPNFYPRQNSHFQPPSAVGLITLLGKTIKYD